jgi:FkbM family methyltransferase
MCCWMDNDMSSLLMNIAAWFAKKSPRSLKRFIYSIQPLAHILRWSLNKAAPIGLTEVQIAGGDLVGARMLLDMQAEKDYWLGTYEMELQVAIRKYISPGMVAYDIGANIGYISLLLGRATGGNGMVYAFEALPANLKRLNENIKLNSMEKRIKVIANAVIDEERSVEFLIGRSGGMGKVKGSAGRTEFHYPETIIIEGISLDHFIYADGNEPPDVIKLDIEGGEILALPGMQTLLSRKRPIILLELHGETATEICWNILSEKNYEICSIHPPYNVIYQLGSLDWKSYLLAFPKAQS